METKKKRAVKKRAEKAIVTQDNRFVYAKYDMNVNELKFFMWIVAQINSQKDDLFKVCEIPLTEIFEIWQWEKGQINYSYIRNMCDSMLKKTYIEDFKLLDEATMKEKNVYQGYTLFKSIRYQEGEGYITYQLNDSLVQYLLNLKRDFTQLKFSDIQQMKSAYSIRIYNILISELKQNRQSLKISLAVLQNILEVPKVYVDRWVDFKRFVLEQAQKDINAKSNLVLLEVKTFKTGRKITDLEFIFDYKNNNKRIARDSEKQKSFNLALANAVNSYIGKKVFFKDYGELICLSWRWLNDDEKEIVANFERISDKKSFYMKVKAFKDINAICRARDRAEEMFYLDTEKVKEAIEFRKQVQKNN